MTTPQSGMQFSLYLPRVLVEWQSADSPATYREIDGTLVFSDISGFTSLSERLAEKGKVGAEEVTKVLNGAFTELLNVAALDGGDLLKFGGDALLNLFVGEGHAARAARAAFDMREALDEYQSNESPVPLSMSVGVASGPVQLFLAGSTSRELVIAGPTANRVTEMETTADSGEVLVAQSTAAELDDFALGDAKGEGILLEDAPDADDVDDEDFAVATPDIDFSRFVSARLRKHLTLAFNEGEHRSANVAFVKLTGFDAVLDAQGPATAASELDAAITEIQEAAERYGVCFLQSDISPDGTKVILTTGVPERGDGDIERMLRAAHEITSIESALDAQIGIASGGVFAGDLGARARRVYTVMGDTVNLAARLASAAAIGTALITKQLADGSGFETTQLDPIELKGKSQPVAPFLLGPPQGSSPVEESDALALVGRDAELAEFAEVLAAAQDGHGRVVDVVGDAGFGKTRLLLEVRTRTSDIPSHVATGEPYEANTAYYVFGQLLRSVLGIEADAGSDEAGAGVAEAIAEHAPQLTAWAPLVARVVGSSLPSTPQIDALDDKFQDSKTTEVVADLLDGLLAGPALAFIDGAQWIDDASRSLLDHLVPTISEHPWVVAIARRPGEGWDDFAGEAELTIELGPLDDAATAELATLAVGEASLPVHEVDALVSRSGGNPYFVMELVAAAISGDPELPANIEAAVAARIDHLQLRDRRLLGYAAVLGQRFSLDLLTDALGDGAAAIDDVDAWGRLGEFLETSVAGKVIFKQPIVRDVAYEGLPFERRLELHRAIGEALERRARNRPERFAELLSVHFDRAEDFEKAWDYSVMAAERARHKYANVEAAELYKRALTAADRMKGEAPPAELATIGEALGDVSEVAGLYDQSDSAYLGALAVVGDSGLDAGRLQLKRGILRERTSDYDEGLEIHALVAAALADAGPEGEEVLLESLVETAAIKSRQGDMEACVAICQDVIDRADPDRHRSVIAHAYYLIEFAYTRLNHPDRGTVGQRAADIYRDMGEWVRLGNVLNNIGYDAHSLGHWDEALQYWTEAKDVRDKAGDIIGSALQENNLAEIFMHRGHFDQARVLLDHALRVWKGAGYEVGIGYANANMGLLESRSGNLDEARRHLDAARDGFTSAGAEAYLPDVRVRYAEFLLAAGDATGASELLAPDIATSTEAGDSLALATLHRLQGIAFAVGGDMAGARACFDMSLELARETRAKYDEALALDALAVWAAVNQEPGDEWRQGARQLIESLGIETESLASSLMGNPA